MWNRDLFHKCYYYLCRFLGIFRTSSQLEKSVEKIRGYCSTEEQQVSSRIEKDNTLFEAWHDKRYLLQCFYNLQEKFDCGGLTPDEWKLVHDKVCKLLNREDLKL